LGLAERKSRLKTQNGAIHHLREREEAGKSSGGNDPRIVRKFRASLKGGGNP